MISSILKRDGRQVPFDINKIASAIYKAFKASGSAKDEQTAMNIALQVEAELERNESIGIPTVEQIQDTVEKALIGRNAAAYVR